MTLSRDLDLSTRLLCRRFTVVITGQLDPANLELFYRCLWVVIVLAVTPWRYVVSQYVTKRGDRWRSNRTGARA